MNKPYIICHMMTSIDSRIDCAMTSQLKGVEDYYTTLDELNIPTTVSGRVTAELEMAEPGIDGREEMPSVFDGRSMNHELTHLKLMDVKRFDSDAIWIRYRL